MILVPETHDDDAVHGACIKVHKVLAHHPDLPLDAVAVHGMADLLGQRDADPCLCISLWHAVYDIGAVGVLLSGMDQLLELLGFPDSVFLLHSLVIYIQAEKKPPCGGSFQAERTFLPFALRLAKTLRPPAVAILALKPCVALFFLLDGWYVLFISCHLQLFIEQSLHYNTCGLLESQ